MPKKPIDFSKTIIYKISKDDDFYVGSTTDFASRKSHHKHTCNTEKSKDYNLKVYRTIRERGGWNEWQMTPLEEYVECQNKIQARIREEEWIDKLQTNLNMRKAFGAETVQEYQKQYYQEHADELKAQKAKYYQEHKEEKAQFYQEHADEINANRAVKFECGCGSVCRISDKARHEASKKHQAYLASLIK